MHSLPSQLPFQGNERHQGHNIRISGVHQLHLYFDGEAILVAF